MWPAAAKAGLSDHQKGDPPLYQLDLAPSQSQPTWRANGLGCDLGVPIAGVAMEFHRDVVHPPDAGQNTRCAIYYGLRDDQRRFLDDQRSISTELTCPHRFCPKARCDHLGQYAVPAETEYLARHSPPHRFQSPQLAATALRAAGR